MPISTPQPLTVRVADHCDISEIVRVTNAAYVVEHGILRGDRTNDADVTALMETGKFLVVEDAVRRGHLRGAVYMSTASGRGYLGLLSVDPLCQGGGVAKALVAAVEEECRRADCLFVDITVINLRKELFPFYTRLGFFASAILPFPRPEVVLRQLHLVQMTKPLRAADEL